MNVQDVTRRTVDSFIAQLQKMKPVSTTYRNARSEFLPPNTIEKVCKVLHCAFCQAVRWDMVPKNPFDDVLLPKKEKNPRAIWTADIIRQALDNCSEGKLYVAINLSFACSLRMGEITGLTWDCVHISDSDIAKDDAHIIVNKELARVDQRAIDALGEKDIIFMFPRIVKAKSTTRLVLKRPKTETSIRKVWLPKTLAYILRDWHQKQDKLKEIMGDEYADYNLVLALETGWPCEDRVIGNQFERLKKSANLPNVVFHSLRHSSTTYKLKLNHGDIKATQGDTGHAQASMVTEVYAHILCGLMLNVALALIPARDDDGQAVFSAQPITDPAYLMVAALVGVVVLVVGEADRIEDQMIVNMPFINMGGKYKLVLATQYFFCQRHPDLMGFLWRHLPRLKSLDQVAT